MCSLVFYKTFFGVELSFFSNSKGLILDELRVSFNQLTEKFIIFEYPLIEKMFNDKVSLLDSTVTFGQSNVSATDSTNVSTVVFFCSCLLLLNLYGKVFGNDFYE